MSSKLWTEEQFNCPVCLDLPNDPVTIPCGHSYCMGCIKDYWSKDNPKGGYSCPQCRKTFSPKPSLSRNTMLAEAVEQLLVLLCDAHTHARTHTAVSHEMDGYCFLAESAVRDAD
uniref:RING-type domain-containing protein n=1 Tax=Cyclopterus lumpus TaxID=8103 RepID=A0A8C2WNC7_CYCLU